MHTAPLLFAAAALWTAAAVQLSTSDNCRQFNATGCREWNSCGWHEQQCRSLRQNWQDDSRCNDGHGPVPCFDVAKCAEGEPGPTADAKWAFVFTNTLVHPFDGLLDHNVAPLREIAERHGNIDILLLVPKRGALLNGIGMPASHNLSPKEKATLTQQGVKVIEVPWALPPGMKFRPKPPWCGPQDLIRLNILGLSGYAAAAYFDSDTQLTGHGDPTQPLRCAAKGHFLTTTGPIAPLNIGYFAVRPSTELMQAAINFAKVADWDRFTGWAGAGQAPNRMNYVGSECGQGFLHALMYKDIPEVREAFQASNATRPKAAQMERCHWNYQHDKGCPGLDCEDVVMIHKGDDEKCQKRGQEEVKAKAAEKLVLAKKKTAAAKMRPHKKPFERPAWFPSH